MVDLNNEKILTDSVYTVQVCKTCLSMQPTQNLTHWVWDHS